MTNGPPLTSTGKPGFTRTTAIAVVMANMVGTGVFTSLGFQLADIRSVFVLLLLWVIGGLAALCGALCYAELGAALPRSGGEYNFLSRVLHPAVGFVAGWVSSTIGFAAPSALAAITFGAYFSSVFPQFDKTMLACGLVVSLTVLHCVSHRSSATTQGAFTWLKVALIVGFCVLALSLAPETQRVSLLPQRGDTQLLTGGAFAVSLIYVSYAYTGWNSATYLSGELVNPQRDLPWILTVGTLTVLGLYLMLNYTFLAVAPMDAMAGQVEVGYVAATYAFGNVGAKVMGVLLSLLLISTVSAMVIAGPRVLQMVGEDFPLFKVLGSTTNGLPRVAIAVQSALTLGFIVSASFEAILVFAGFTLAANTLAVVACLFLLRIREPDLARPFKVPLYPLPPLIYMAITLWTLYYVVQSAPQEAFYGGVIFALGTLMYFVTVHLQKRSEKTTAGTTEPDLPGPP